MAFKEKLGFRRRFEFGLAWRTAVLIAAIVLLAEAMAAPGLRAARLVTVLIALAETQSTVHSGIG